MKVVNEGGSLAEAEHLQSKATSILFTLVHRYPTLTQAFQDIRGYAMLAKVFTSSKSIVGFHLLKVCLLPLYTGIKDLILFCIIHNFRVGVVLSPLSSYLLMFCKFPLNYVLLMITMMCTYFKKVSRYFCLQAKWKAVQPLSLSPRVSVFLNLFQRKMIQHSVNI